MKHSKTILGGALAPALLAAAVVAGPQVAVAAAQDKQPIFDVATGDRVTGGFSMLNRADDSIATKVRTAANPGHANTMWYVIFNAPENCSDGECGHDDIFNEDESFNAARIEATRVSVVWAGAGAVTNPGGRLKLDGGLAEGEFPDGPNQLVIGRGEDGALVPLSPVTGVEDAQVAVVVIIIQDHGPAHDDADQRNVQLSQFNGACNPDCVDLQIAMHLP